MSGSLRLALCALLVGTASAWALAPHDRFEGPLQQQFINEHTEATQNKGVPLFDERGTADRPLVVKTISSEKNPYEAAQEAKDQKDKNRVERITIFLGIITATFAILQTVIFAFQAYIFNLQAKSLENTISVVKELGSGQSKDMQESLRIAAEASRASQAASDTATQQLVRDSDALIARERAYYAFDSFGIVIATLNGIVSQWIFEIIWKNHGNRPPRNIISCVSMQFFDSPVRDDFLFPDRPVNPDEPFGKRVFVAPHATIRGVRVPIMVEDLELVAKGKKYLSIWGWVEYDDGFVGTPRRRSEFAADVQVIGIVTQTNPGHVNPRMHPHHNGTDDECMKPATT